MATINNSDLKKELIDGAKIQLSVDNVPGELAKSVVPVMEVNPKLLRTCNIVRNCYSYDTGPATVYTTPTDKDFFLTNAVFSSEDDVTSDSTSPRMEVVIDKQTQILLSFRKISGTATSKTMALNFNSPIKLDRGSVIQISRIVTVGVSIINGTIVGYTVED